MSEEQAIAAIKKPQTYDSLKADLSRLGITRGMTLLVHSSLSAMGWVCGGAQTVVQVLLDILTEEGTLVMPAHSGNYSDPAHWQNPPVPQDWWPVIYECMPAFDSQITGTYHMGIIAETFRTWPGTVRSNHPQVSFCARGKHAHVVTANHALAYGLGEQSPLRQIYNLQGSVLLLGVGYDRNTSFHLAEYRTTGINEVRLGAPIYENGTRVWKWFPDLDLNSDIFPLIGKAMEQKSQIVTHGMVGAAQARLFAQKPAVDFAVDWYQHRNL